jgi:hypothetical protein
MKANGFTDWAAAMAMTVGAKGFRFLAGNRPLMPRFQAASDKAGVALRTTHYYEPTYRHQDLPEDITKERSLPGVDFNAEGQLALLARCTFADELRAIPAEIPGPGKYGYNNGAFGPGDGEMLYNLIRLVRPKRLLEVGSGHSTCMARLAIQANQRDDPAYTCQHVCIEPYEMPWLESTGVTVIRKLVEKVGLGPTMELEDGDILFIDSSHIIRPYGDVLFEFHEMIPSVAPGVYVHVHDIHTPREYPEKWVRGDRRLWNEQYLLESFLAFNSAFEIVSMLNWLHHNHTAALGRACPILGDRPEEEPGSFWIRRRPA